MIGRIAVGAHLPASALAKRGVLAEPGRVRRFGTMQRERTVRFLVLDVRVYDRHVRLYGRGINGRCVVCETDLDDSELELRFIVPGQGEKAKETAREAIKELYLRTFHYKGEERDDLDKMSVELRQMPLFYGFESNATGTGPRMQTIAVVCPGRHAPDRMCGYFLSAYLKMLRMAEASLQDRPLLHGVRFAGDHGKGVMVAEIMETRQFAAVKAGHWVAATGLPMKRHEPADVALERCNY